VLLDRATALDYRFPTYFGAPGSPSARLWLDTNLLGACRPSAADHVDHRSCRGH
jgi:hypothetical protein